MKTTIQYLIFFALLLCAASSSLAQSRLEVTVRNIKEPKGTIRVGLFTNEKDFLKNAAEGKVVKAEGTQVTVVFNDLKPGDYGISVIHDENGNEELDTNVIGLPKEGFAFGNNAMGAFGPPAFEKAKVTVNNNSIIQTIDLKYF
jgi:uncharacterized protein (DUF2141 family)